MPDGIIPSFTHYGPELAYELCHNQTLIMEQWSNHRYISKEFC